MSKTLFAPGHTACAGCGQSLAARLVIDASGPNTIVVNNTGCLEVFSTKYPESSWEIPWIHSLFENAAAVASGVESALKYLGKKDTTNVIAQGGDGGTADIGLQALSGMLERGHDILYVCYDNEAYMNTGVQRSGLTPTFARTTTTPSGKRAAKKDMLQIVMAHGIDYAATCCVSYPFDLIAKAKKAKEINGPAFLHVLTPCPPGWGYEPAQTIQMGRLAVQTGVWRLIEYEQGTLKETHVVAKPKPIEEYLRAQRRFRGISETEISKMKETVEKQ